MDIARACPLPTLCWIFADTEGHIGRQANGWFPDRAKGTNGLLPIPAWDERNHWRGRLPAAVLPRSYDPPEGFVAAANEDMNSAGGPRLVTMIVPDYRRRRIDQRLRELDQATLDDMQALQYDVVSLQAAELLPIFLPHLAEGEMKRRLAAWDCDYSPPASKPRGSRGCINTCCSKCSARSAASAGGGCCTWPRASDFRPCCSRPSTACSSSRTRRGGRAVTRES